MMRLWVVFEVWDLRAARRMTMATTLGLRTVEVRRWNVCLGRR